MAVVLIDMDGVVANIEESITTWIAEWFPNSVDNGSGVFSYEDRYGLKKHDLNDFFEGEGYFSSFPVIEGAIEGVAALAAHDHVIKFCTAPVHESKFCASEKQVWINTHFPEYTRDLIITKDKTMVRGDVLIDDKPWITGVYKPPAWTHVRYGKGYFEWDRIELLLRALKDLDELNKPLV